MKTPLISIIVPVYKVEKYIHTCVESILNQTYTNWELILVDDGSPDSCPAICDQYAVKDQRIKVIHKKNGGLSSARNIALDFFKGEYVTFLDSDDFWHSDYLKILLGLCLDKEADIAQCDFVRGTEKVFPETKYTKNSKVFDNQSIFLKGYARIIICAKLYKRHLFDGLRMPEGKINEDDFTTWKCYYNSKIIVVTNDKLYYYTINNQSIMSISTKQPRLDFMEAYKDRIDFFISNSERSMEDFSRIHFCKSLLLTANNTMLSSEQRNSVFQAFIANWQKIKHSKHLGISLRVLFMIFRFFPKITLRLLNLVR